MSTGSIPDWTRAFRPYWAAFSAAPLYVCCEITRRTQALKRSTRSWSLGMTTIPTGLLQESYRVIFESLRASACSRQGSLGYTEYSEMDNGYYTILGSVLGCQAL